MLLFGSRRRSYRELPLRYAESSTPAPGRAGGTLHGLLRVRHVTQDDAHVFVTEEQIQEEIHGNGRVRPVPLRPVRPDGAGRALDATDKRLGTDEQWDRAEAALEAALKSTRSTTSSARARARSTARRSTCT